MPDEYHLRFCPFCAMQTYHKYLENGIPMCIRCERKTKHAGRRVNS